MKKIKVDLGRRSYPIYIGRGEKKMWKHIFPLLKHSSPIVITSKKIARLCLGRIKKGLPKVRLKVIFVPEGESAKSLKTIARVYQQLIRLGADRKTPILLLGGGVVGDLGAFAASSYLRGLPFIHFPTTLVAQVDSSIGGKTGVDLPQGKNLVGSFSQPMAVFADATHLKKLPMRDLKAGLAEVIKYGLISDPRFFDLVLKNRSKIFSRDLDFLQIIVSRSAAHKAWVTSKDEKEGGLRKTLNFGHTLGHALEKITHYRRFRHGEAIAIGMVMAAKISAKLGYCSVQVPLKIENGLQLIGPPTDPPKIAKSRYLTAIGVDKKRLKGKIHFVFITRIGKVTVKPIDTKKLVALL
jgi:3-dehydroquinate synthase